VVTICLQEPYRTRTIRPLDLWKLERWRLKVYGIVYGGTAPRASLVEAARTAVQNAVCALDPADSNYGVGWVTVHDARDSVFVLLDWWGGENMVFQRLWHGSSEAPASLTGGDLSAPVMCVWELAVAAAERQAWIDCVLANPAGPDLERYLTVRLSDDV
jgi:hypothetical protein